jgi:hypothetical protein
MKNTFLKTIGTALAILMLVMFAQTSVSAQDNNNEEIVTPTLKDSSTRSENNKKLEGSWNVLVTPRNCLTGVPIAATTPSVLTYNYGGTMMEFGTRNSPTLRSPGQGIWSQESARHYTSAFQFFRFNADGTLAGRQIIRQEIELSESGDEFTGIATGQVLDAAGNVISSGCTIGIATRFE